ncbi:hypothetical protein SLEP1_g38652 [Rubroshorea leprosula]|uniref:Uncharacterized protein n=1 Tax=Rubroshorea leprosula TaxID=152421 RepID=A0AAV5KXR2_9ROSI|nr:hypothetical protein SLEP1_g38652 [Rubroshorea leprosula]
MRERGRERERGAGGGQRTRATWTTWNRKDASSRGGSQRRGQEEINQYQGEQGHQKNSRTQKWGFYDKGLYKQAIPYFFTNFPEEWSYADMWRTFLKFGRVYDIYSPNRKSRSGARFGFVRFLNVHDKRELERQLDQIWIGDWKLWVNFPRYDDVKKEEKKEGKGQGSIPKYQSRSYAEVLRGNGVGNAEGVSKGQYRTELLERGENRKIEGVGTAENRKVWKEKGKGANWTGMEYNIKEEEFAWLEGCYVGTVHSVEMVRNLQEKFYMEGYFYCRVRAMGGKMVLLDCEEKEELRDLVEMAAEWLAQWFSEIKPWTPELVAKERFVWIKCHGAPLNAWRSDFFEKMGSTWGKFICLDDSTSNKRRFDVARFLISTHIMDSISVTRQIKINGVLYNVKFKEEEFTNNFFSLKQDFLPSFHSGSEENESWSWDTDMDSMENGCRKTKEPAVELNSDAEEEDDEVAGHRGINGNKHQAQEEEAADSMEKFQNSNKGAGSVDRLEETQGHGERTASSVHRERAISAEKWEKEGVEMGLEKQDIKRTKKGPKPSKTRSVDEESTALSSAQSVSSPIGPNRNECSRIEETEHEITEEEDIDLFWKGFESEEGRLKQWMGRRADLNRTGKKKKKKTRSCRSIYSIDQVESLAGAEDQSVKNQGKKRTTELGKKTMPALSTSSGSRAAGISIGDTEIRNCNKLAERKRQDQQPADLWDFAKKLGVVAMDEQQIKKRIEEMEKRDKEEKASMLQPEEASTKKAANGLAGGLLCIWNSKVFRKIEVIEGDNYLGVCGLWGEDDTEVYIINIYSPCQLAGKRALWEDLQKLIINKGGKWCLAGDFNAVRKIEERAGSREVTREMKEFDEFIQNTGLIDLPLVGRRYTWYNSNGKYMSRIDRFLLTEEWILKWCDMKQWGLNRFVSDHCPILLKNEKMDWGPKPFKFFDAWLDQPGCKEIIREVWKSTIVRGWKGYILKEKLKRTKKELKEWSRNSVLEVDKKLMEAEKGIAIIDERGENCQLSTQEIDQRRNCFIELWKNLKIKESMWQQKSRRMWLKEGDANTKYFHRCAKGRWRRNEILCIRIKGVQHTGVAEIKNEVAKYFEELFTEEKWERPKLDGVGFKRISEADNDILIAAFSEKEIKEAVWECESSKSPGPDGFNFKFVKVMWEDIKSDVVEFVQEFHEHGKIAKGSNASFIVLIPKVENPQKIEEYRPISLIGVMYKILAKLLANRLRRVIDKVIGEQQMAFLRGRQLAEGAVIANEVIDEAKRKKKKSFIFKVDFEKAYDKGRGIGSLWWRDVGCLNNVDEEKEGWLTEGFKLILGEGKGVSFWRDNWGGEGDLANLFPRLYNLSTGKEKKCCQMGNEEDGTWRWNLEWRRALFDWEREEATELQRKIDSMRIYKDIPDTWKWEHSKEGIYSTQTAYKLLTNELSGLDAAPIHKRVWNPIIPSKISAFNWQLLQDRIPTKSNLQRRGITTELEDGICALCEEEAEDSNHLFLRCKVAKWLWKACGKWWGISVNLENDCWKSFELFGVWAKETRVKEGWDCIWNVVVWTIWLARNQKIFRDSDINKSVLGSTPGFRTQRLGLSRIRLGIFCCVSLLACMLEWDLEFCIASDYLNFQI